MKEYFISNIQICLQQLKSYEQANKKEQDCNPREETVL